MTPKNKLQLSSTVGVALLTLTTSLIGCSPETNQTPVVSPTATEAQTVKPETLPQVVATDSVTCGLTKEIAGETIDLKCLIDPGSDPHVYEPKPDDRKSIETAQLILYAGYNFEPSLIKLITATSNPAPKIAVNEIAVPSPLMSEDGHSHDHEKESKSNPTAEKEVDPHVWHSAKNGIEIARTISKNLIALRPDKAETYTQNTTRVTTEIDRIDTWIKAQIATIPASQRKLVTTHDALGYYSKTYGVPIEGALSGISTEEQPTATRIKELVKVIKDAQVPTVFAEITINPKLIEAVAKEANVKVSERELFADGLGAKGSEAETYAGMLIANTKSIVEGLGGKYTPFVPK